MEQLKWTLVKSTYLHKDVWFTARRDVCKKPDGNLVDPYYVFEFPTWVTIVALTEDMKFVMVTQYRHAIGEVCIELPGGCVDAKDKDLQTAAARELQEETGYTFQDFIYLGKTAPNPSTNSNWMHMYLATGGRKTSDQQLDANEEIIVSLKSLEEIRQLLMEQKIVQAMHVTCLHYAFEKMKEQGIIS